MSFINLLIYIIILQMIYIISQIINIIIIKMIIGTLILTFVPGILILLFLLKERINNLELSEIIMYSIGLSLSFWAFFEFLLNNIVLLGINFENIKIKLFTKLIITCIINITVFALLLSGLKYRKYHLIFKINNFLLKNINNDILLTCILILSILGINLINYYNTNIIALFSIIVLVSVLLAAAFDKNVNGSFAIWVISLSLLYLNSLLGQYFRATDNICEYYFSNLILKEGYWNPLIPAGLNAMLGVVMLVPTYSLICSTSLNYVFKIIVPFIASFIPIGLYIAFKRITNEKIAFLSSFFFVSMYEYYTWLGLTMKMVTAGLYMALLIMILTDNKLDNFAKNVLSIIFGISLAVSHYGTSYIFMFCIVGAFFVNKIINRFTKNKDVTLLTLTFITLYITFTISWYIYNSLSSLYKNMINIGNHIVRSIAEEYILPEKSYIYRIVKGQLPPYLQILKTLYIIATALMIIGITSYIVYIVLKRKLKLNIFNNIKINSEYLSFSILYCIAGGTVFLGGLSGMATPDRIYLLISFFLAPFCIIGGIVIIKLVKLKIDPLKLLSIYLIIFLLFNTCFAAEVIWRYNVGPMVSLSEPRIVKSGTLDEKEYLDRVYMFQINMIGAEWLRKYMKDYPVYCPANSGKYMVFVGITKITWEHGLKKTNVYKLTNRTNIRKMSYIYLSEFNVETGKMKIRGAVVPVFVNVSDNPKIKLCNKIYTNGKCYILYYSG